MLDGRGALLRSDVWIESLYISIILTSVGRLMKAYTLSYFFPIYASVYSLAMYELMRYGFHINPDWAHRIGFLIMLLPGFYVAYRLSEHIKNLKLQDEMQYSAIERIANQKENTHGEDK